MGQLKNKVGDIEASNYYF